MDPANRVRLEGLLFTAVLPVVAALAPLVLARFLGRASTDDRPRTARVGLAVLAGVTAAYLGVMGSPLGPDAYRAILFGALLGGALGTVVDLTVMGKTSPAEPLRLLGFGLLGAAVGVGTTYLMLSPLEALWSAGPVAAVLGKDAFAVDALAVALLAGLVFSRAGSQAPAPAVLGSLALGLAGLGAATALSGSARVGQLAGAVGMAVGAVGLAGFVDKRLRVGHGAALAGWLTLTAGVIYAQSYVDLPRPVALLLLLTPAAAGLVALGRSLFIQVALPLALAAGLTGGAVYLARAVAEGSEAAPPAEDTGPDYSNLGGY